MDFPSEKKNNTVKLNYDENCSHKALSISSSSSFANKELICTNCVNKQLMDQKMHQKEIEKEQNLLYKQIIQSNYNS